MNAHNDLVDSYIANETFLRDILERFGQLTRRRPRRFFDLLLRLFVQGEVRRIVRLDTGLIYYLNPLSHIGRHVLERGGYELDNYALFRQHIKRGDVVLDVGANEGYFTALFGLLAGPEGQVIAVEPQSRLCDLIKINCLLNGVANCHAFQNALGRAGAEDSDLALYSTLNTGMSSLVKSYKSTIGYERVSFITIENLMRQSGVTYIDVVKVDTEGYEAEVVEGMLETISRGMIRKIFIDYHDAILRGRGLSAYDIHESLAAAGMTLAVGRPDTLDGYVLYEWKQPTEIAHAMPGHDSIEMSG